MRDQGRAASGQAFAHGLVGHYPPGVLGCDDLPDHRTAAGKIAESLGT